MSANITDKNHKRNCNCHKNIYKEQYEKLIAEAEAARDKFLAKALIFSEANTTPITPFVSLNGTTLTFRMVTLEQMAKVRILTNNGEVTFTLLIPNEAQLWLSDACPEELRGQEVVAVDEATEIQESIEVVLPQGYEVTYVGVEGTNGNLLNADVNWRLAYIKQAVERIKESTMDDITYQQAIDILNNSFNN